MTTQAEAGEAWGGGRPTPTATACDRVQGGLAPCAQRPAALHPAPCALRAARCAQHHAPCALCLAPCTVDRGPSRYPRFGEVTDLPRELILDLDGSRSDASVMEVPLPGCGGILAIEEVRCLSLCRCLSFFADTQTLTLGTLITCEIEGRHFVRADGAGLRWLGNVYHKVDDSPYEHGGEHDRNALQVLVKQIRVTRDPIQADPDMLAAGYNGASQIVHD
eukprot:CAMPEP_0174706286 /NCGR_PEP_ID=MMETSP1094-20130205/9201_1 /TAXON_ID=156173 /ORGANISM="Chrysochromulina brevifilum, Strain UTEX LB 985" /LENGTH=219 /DNA_ID=CAMNT_0015904539 /DNA_START=315 /DNA_END=969 /DNA_ORIENTATION=+